MARIIRVNTTLAHHLILHGYGHWLSNDPRGSMSEEIKQQWLKEFGDIHYERKEIQPTRDELKRFYRKVSKYLAFEPLWFDERIRAVIGQSFEATTREFGYTVWACAICWNHSHLVTRVHRDTGQAMWDTFTGRSRMALVAHGLASKDHPVWSDRCYTIYKTSVPAVWSAVRYVERNPEKEGLPKQVYPWIKKYDGWPRSKRRS